MMADGDTQDPVPVVAPLDPTDLTPGRQWVFGPGMGAAGLYKNLESYGGQVLWTPPPLSAKAESRIARRDAVRQARHVERSNEHIRGGLDRKANMVVGATLRARPQPNWQLLNDVAPGAGLTREWAREFADRCYRQFLDWSTDTDMICDAEGHDSFAGMMWTGYRNVAGPDAECGFVVITDRERAARLGTRWWTTVALIDPEQIETPPEQAGREDVFDGLHLDDRNRTIGGWIRKHHPSDLIPDSNPFEYVPRSLNGRPVFIHYFRRYRGRAKRGMTTLITALRHAIMLDKFDDAYLASAIINSVMATYIKTAASAEVMGQQLAPGGRSAAAAAWPGKAEYYVKSSFKVGSQTLPIMREGDEIVMAAVNRALGDPGSFRNGFLREFSLALGLSYEQTSNNFSEANYSSARAALLEVWRGITVERALYTHAVASPIYGAVVEEAIAKGWIPLPPGAPDFRTYRNAYLGVAWTGPGMGWIDPKKEAEAAEIRVRNRFTNRDIEAAANGDDWREITDQAAFEAETDEELGLPPIQSQPQQQAAAAADDPSSDEPRTAPATAPEDE